MTFLRNLGHDLVDKKLWPIAVVLVLAVIAVPFLLGGGDDVPVAAPATGSTATATAAVAPPASAEVAVALEEPVLTRRSGKTRDPFKQQYVVKAKDAVAAVTGATGVADPGGKGTTAPATGGGKTSTPSTGGTTPTTPSKPTTVPKLDPLDVYRVALRFGEPGAQKTIRDIARLSPLPNAEQPFFIFLGVLSGGKKAVFLVSSDAQVTGDGTCRPSPTNCETVEMAKGDTVFLDRETDEGVVQYELDLVSVKRRTAAQAVAARRVQAAQSDEKRQQAAAKDDAAEELTDAYRWDADRGVLVRRKRASTARVAVAETVADPTAVPVSGTEHTAAEYRAWYIAVYIEYLRQLAVGSQAAAATQATLAVVPQP